MLHGSTERLHHLAKIYEERIAPLLIPVFSRYRIGTFAPVPIRYLAGATGKSLNMMSNQALCMVKPTIPLVANLPGSAWLVTAGC
ncbi:hypothetical protein DXI34_23890 [Salmonella enterica]|nr:hypothetical protein [Salmonella enterica]